GGFGFVFAVPLAVVVERLAVQRLRLGDVTLRLPVGGKVHVHPARVRVVRARGLEADPERLLVQPLGLVVVALGLAGEGPGGGGRGCCRTWPTGRLRLPRPAGSPPTCGGTAPRRRSVPAVRGGWPGCCRRRPCPGRLPPAAGR